MKKLLLLMVISFSPISCSVATADSYSGAIANSNASAVTSSGSQAISGGGTAIAGGGTGGVGVGASNFTVNPSVSINSTGSDLSQAVPLVTAPQMTVLGGDDSCLKSRSAGVGLSGFGGSFGTMVMDNECNRRRMHSYLAGSYPGVAMEILCGSPIVWAAFNREAEAHGGQSVCDNALPKSADQIQEHMASNEVTNNVYEGKTLYDSQKEEAWEGFY